MLNWSRRKFLSTMKKNIRNWIPEVRWSLPSLTPLNRRGIPKSTISLKIQRRWSDPFFYAWTNAAVLLSDRTRSCFKCVVMCLLPFEVFFLEESQDCHLYPGRCCPSSQTATSSSTAQPKEEATSAATTKSPASQRNMLLDFVTNPWC